MKSFNQRMIQEFGTEHANMNPDSPNKYFDVRISHLNNYLDIQFIEKRVLQKLPLPRRAKPRILDVGAGKGRMTRRFAEIAAHCVAIEPFPEFYQVLISSCTGENIEIYQCTLQEYEKMTEQRFDIIYVSGVTF